MNTNAFEVIENYYKENDWKFESTIDNIDSDDMLEILEGGECVNDEFIDSRRWFDIYEYIVKFGDKYLRYEYAQTTGDDSPSAMGYELDLETIYEVRPVQKQVTITVYEVV